MSLFEGAQSGNLALVRHALATEGQDDLVEYVNRRNIVGERPLHLASKNHDPDEEAPIIGAEISAAPGRCALARRLVLGPRGRLLGLLKKITSPLLRKNAIAATPQATPRRNASRATREKGGACLSAASASECSLELAAQRTRPLDWSWFGSVRGRPSQSVIRPPAPTTTGTTAR